MRKIVIVGASVAGHSAAVRLREKDPGIQIALVTDEEYPFYDRRKLPELLAGKITEKEVFLCTEDFYQIQNIEFIKGKRVSGVNTARQQVYFRQKGSLSYDFLVIAIGRPPEFPDIPGARKPGAEMLYGLGDAKQFLSRVIIEPVCIIGSSQAARQAASAIAARYKVEVKVIGRPPADAAALPEGVEWIDTSVEEIIGEGQVQAVKISGGKVIGVTAVLFMQEGKSIDFLKDTALVAEQQFIKVNEDMQTSMERIFACGSVAGDDGSAGVMKSWEACVEEGFRLADYLIQTH